MNDKHYGCENEVNTTSNLNTDPEKKEERPTPSQEEKGTYQRQETRGSLETWESYCQRNDTGISKIPKKSSSTYYKQPNFETRTTGKYRKQVRMTMKSRISKETWMKGKKK